MELGLFRDFFGNFSTRDENYYFHIHKVQFMRGEIEMNIGKLGTLKNSNFFSGGGDLWWVWQGVGVWIRSWMQGVGVWIRSWGLGMGVQIRSWGHCVGVWIRS